MATINDKLADLAIELNVRSLQGAKHFAQESEYILTNLQRELTNLITSEDFESLTLNQRRRIASLQRQANTMIANAYDLEDETLQINLDEIPETMGKALGSGVNRIVGNVIDVSVNATELGVLTSDPMVQGAPASDYWKRQSADTQFKFIREMRDGILRGETNQELVNRIIGNRTGNTVTEIDPKTGRSRKVPERAGGVMGVSRRDATALVRTSVQSVSNNTLQAIYKQNDDVIRGIRIYATLDGKTTPICISLDGGTWLNNGEPFPGSIVRGPYPGPPPYHWQCRTVIAPIVVSWSQLNSKDPAKASMIPGSKRASMDGQVPKDLTYGEWIKTKPVEFQVEVLGKTTQRLLSEGKITVQQLSNKSLKPLSVAELRRKYE